MGASTAGDAAATTKSFRAHLQTLRDFADELRGQIHALGAVRNTSATLDSLEVRLGAFTEADSLLARHALAVTELTTLLTGVEDALHFAEEVTDVVVTQFSRQADQFAASLAGVDVSQGGPPGGNGRNGAA
jgi:hypothetical protein